MKFPRSLLLLGAGAVLAGAGGLLLHHHHVAARAALAHADATTKHDYAASLGGLDAIRDAYSSTTDGVVRADLLAAAARVGTPEAARWLASVATSGDRLGGQAGAAIGAITDGRARPALVDLVRSTEPALVRANAARALGRTGTPDDAETLAALVGDGTQPVAVREQAALALARVGTRDVVPRLAAVLDATAADPSSDATQLRIAVVRALGGIDSAEARAALERHRARRLGPAEKAFTDRALATR